MCLLFYLWLLFVCFLCNLMFYVITWLMFCGGLGFVVWVLVGWVLVVWVLLVWFCWFELDLTCLMGFGFGSFTLFCICGFA